ncbi:carboxypeptidase regulatory-like domain-containing protein [Hymenobacter sp. H14-R3]|uniref:carboxypeptidase-like regulatory domain-containing protein n=1 Tax=Hymenobacter sp. H14-R3 TaxID=3046308 RepID=UPI0024BB78C3|nr:carboxypeptidase regulatory-like domain-containing protein [Hymenobacter sp. H14-R3]MDJ0364593.1 carboxypeptidase regulatory-like domain-containing protein [Hymenobacter sp. H14-R3]
MALAGPALAGNDPISKRPAAPHRTHQVLDTVIKAPAATSAAKKTPAAQPASPATTLVAVATEQPDAAPTAPHVIKLKGIVLNANGQPCPGASVYPAGAPRQLVITDANGAFALPVPAGGPVSLRVEYFGVGSSRVEVAAPSTDVLHITLGQ